MNIILIICSEVLSAQGFHYQAASRFSDTSGHTATNRLDILSLLLDFLFVSVCVREQARRVWPAAGPKADAPAAGSFWTRPGEHCVAARCAGLRGLRLPAQSALRLSAIPVRRWRDHTRWGCVCVCVLNLLLNLKTRNIVVAQAQTRPCAVPSLCVYEIRLYYLR